MKEEFFEVCRDAEPAKSNYVSLYVSIPFYGGPEEGGWWGSDTALIAYQQFNTEEHAKNALERIKSLTEEGNAEERKAFGEQCLRQSEWLEARGLDDDFLSEPNGEKKFWATIEDTPGKFADEGDRYYS